MPQKSSAKKRSETESSPKKAPKLPKLPTEFIVRPHTPETALRDTANVYVSQTLLEITGWPKGSFIKVSKGLTELTCILSTWSEQDEDKYGLNVVLVSPDFLGSVGFVLGDRVSLHQTIQPSYATEVTIRYTGSEVDAKKTVEEIGLIYSGLTTSKIQITQVSQGIEEKMAGLSLEDTSSQLTPCIFHPVTTEVVLEKTEKILRPQTYSFDEIGGLDVELGVVKRSIEMPMNHPDVFKDFGIQPPRGILLYGPSGTGKSMILNAVPYEWPDCHTIRINGPEIVSKYLGGTEESLRDYFKEATKYSPSLILIDEIDSLVPSRGADETSEVDSRVIATMLTLLDGLTGQVVVIGATNRPGSIDLSLRRPGRFDQELEISIPTVEGRFDILKKQFAKMGQKRSGLSQDQIHEIASKTHGYVGADLVSLTREAIMKCISQSTDLGVVQVNYDDILQAMQEVRPSAMREIVLEMPKVKWSDIGGQEVLKRKLREMVQLPLTATKTFERLGISAPKGLLLYGPPGCSKTMTAKALASESGLNFLAIKGPEIFNKYVGESEKKIREIFRKARLSSPSIIFIDEIDAIATSRDSTEGHVSQQVLNTMLNEIDGVEELKGVIIIGATNRPDSIDPALLRPGRLDRHVYVGPPDAEARKQILQKNSAKFGVDADTIDNLVGLTDGFSGSECVLLCQEAGLNAIMEDKSCTTVKQSQFIHALDDMSKNITPEMLEYYRDFADKYRASGV